MSGQKIKCVLLDDELPGLMYLRMLCEQIPALEVVKAFNDPLKFMQEMETIEFDLCILDIEMPGVNGIEIARQLKNKYFIFTTAYKEFAAEAFDLDAIDYIRKPILKDRLESGIEKVLKRSMPAKTINEFIQLNTSKGKALVYFDQIVYITVAENDKRDKRIFLSDGSQLHVKNMSYNQLSELLPSNQFCQINKKDLIAVKKVRSYTSQEIIVFHGNEIKLSLSETFKDSFLSIIDQK